MSEELGKDIALEATKAVALEAYKDVAQPTMRAIGGIVALPFQAIDAALSDAKLWVAEKHYNFERTRELLAEKMKNVPPENIVPPENYVAVPAMKQIAYCFDSDELREMYANLLASSMQADKKWSVHPAFVDIIKQLTPDEAKLLTELKKRIYDNFPILDVKIVYVDGGYNILLSNYSNYGNDVCYHPENIGAYLENLDRLKIIEIDKNNHIFDDNAYKPLIESPQIKLITAITRPNSKYDFEKGIFKITAFGKGFIKTCIG